MLQVQLLSGEAEEEHKSLMEYFQKDGTEHKSYLSISPKRSYKLSSWAFFVAF